MTGLPLAVDEWETLVRIRGLLRTHTFHGFEAVGEREREREREREKKNIVASVKCQFKGNRKMNTVIQTPMRRSALLGPGETVAPWAALDNCMLWRIKLLMHQQKINEYNNAVYRTQRVSGEIIICSSSFSLYLCLLGLRDNTHLDTIVPPGERLPRLETLEPPESTSHPPQMSQWFTLIRQTEAVSIFKIKY